MQAMGLELVVRNQAIGNNPCFPYDACVATHMGKDLDILTWEQVRLLTLTSITNEWHDADHELRQELPSAGHLHEGRLLHPKAGQLLSPCHTIAS